MTEMKEKICPELPTIREQPTAPNVINGGSDDRGHSYRLNIIREIQAFLEEEINKREAFSKKYFRIAKVVNMVDNALTLSQTSNFRLIQIERVCRRQFQFCLKCQKALLTGRKHCGKRRNCSLRAISPFPIVFSKVLYCRHVKTRACLGKG